jgi:transcriptional regulator with XRE-family HTH domain
MKLFEKLLNPREIRKRLGLNQQEFWTKIGVTQSGGSRYESGRNMPKPVRELLRLVYVEELDLSRVKKEDFDVIDYLKTTKPELFKQLRKEAKDEGKKTSAEE